MGNFENLFQDLKLSVLNYKDLFFNKSSFNSKISDLDWKNFDSNIILLNELFEGINSQEDFVEFCPEIISSFVNIYEILNKDRKTFSSQLKVLFGWRRFLEHMCCLETKPISIEDLKPLNTCQFADLF